MVPRVLGYGTAAPAQVWRAVAEVEGRVIEVLSTPSDVALPCAVEPPCADTTPACVGRQADLCAPAAVADGPPRTEVLT